MNDLPRQKLCELIATYGRSLCDDPRRCEALLKDLCSQYRREVSVLVIALREGVAADLLASQRVPHKVLLARLTKRLHDNRAIAEDAALWAVESWALALGVVVEIFPPMVDIDIFPPPVRLKYAGFWQRFAAALIDGLILCSLWLLSGAILYWFIKRVWHTESGEIVILWFVVLNWLYCAFMESSHKQGTLGKMALGIVVTDLNKNKISFSKATVRHLGKLTALGLAFTSLGIAFVIDYLPVVVTEKKQAIHDMVVGCFVVKNR